jgi:methionine-rich copper-binding protein CopC
MRASVPARAAALTAAFGLASAAGIFTAAPALAHDELVGSSPAAGATLTALPKRVVLRFEEPPARQGIRMTVVDPRGGRLNRTGPQLNGSTLSEALRPSKRRGDYVISFHIVSDDGHPVSGTIRFTVAAAAPVVAAAPPVKATPTAAAGSSTTNTWIAAGAAVIVLGAGAAAATSLRRRRALIAPHEPVLSPQPDRVRVPS